MSELHNKIIHYFKNKSNPIILDVGSYRLEDSIEFSNLFPESIIYSFECDIRNIEAISDYPKNICLEPLAVGNIDGYIDFYQSQDIDFSTEWFLSGSIHKPTGHLKEYTVRFKPNPIKVKGIKLDTWYEKIAPNKIELIYCDVNGGEGDFLLGAEETLKQTNLLYIETFDKQLYENQVNTAWVLDKLKNWEVLFRHDHNLLLENKNYNE